MIVNLFHKEKRLAKKAMQGSKRALQNLVSDNIDFCYSMVFFLTNNKEDSEEIIKETFNKLSKSIYKLKKPAYFKIYLYKILKETINELRKNNNEEIESIESFNTEEKEPILKIIKKLPEFQKEVILLIEIHNFSINQVSLLTQKEIKNVKTALYKAKRKIIKAMDLNDKSNYSISIEKE